MINFDDYTNENIIEHNSKWSYIPDHPYRILIIDGSGSGKNLSLEIINEIKRIKELEKQVDRTRMVYKGTNKTYDFRNYQTIRVFGNEIRNNVISLETANIEQANLLSYINDFMKTKPRDPEKRKLRSDALNSVTGLITGRERVLTAFRSGIFEVLKESQEGEGANKMSRVKQVSDLKY